MLMCYTELNDDFTFSEKRAVAIREERCREKNFHVVDNITFKYKVLGPAPYLRCDAENFSGAI
jgi:hypothetical protein